MARNWLVHQLATWVALLSLIFPSVNPCLFYPLANTSSEVIIPKRLDSKDSHSNHLSYLIKAMEENYVIHLKPRRWLVGQNIPVFTYDSQGQRTESYPYIPDDCYYEGYVDGLANSRVALKVCPGLRGFLKIRDRSYGIEPLQASPTFQHLLYLTKGLEDSFGNCSIRAEKRKYQAKELRRSQPKRRSPDPRHHKYIELYIVVDQFLFQEKHSNETEVMHSVLDVINIASLHFKSFHTSITLIGLEIWNVYNLIYVSDEIVVVLNKFNSWRSSLLVKFISHDTAYLFVHQKFAAGCGHSYSGSICNKGFSAGVLSYISTNPALLATVFSHVMGHHLGLEHDDDQCFCIGDQKCIMHSADAAADQFSNCSIQHFNELVLGGDLDCLLNTPKKITVSPHCGNGFLDSGEQCDCGGIHKCQQDPCCTPACTFKPGVECSSGECCQDCKLLPRGYRCRDQTGECDLPEFCDGDNPWCPGDYYVQDWTPCAGRKSYCHRKMCWSLQFLCTRLFGEGATAAPKKCFLALNANGDNFGNCGHAPFKKDFFKCRPADAMCGRLHCSNVQKMPRLTSYIFLSLPLEEGLTCWSASYGGVADEVDLGNIPDGTQCDHEKACMNHSCVALPRMSCNPAKKCFSQGVCNNRHNCHCNYGWAPPFCRSWGTGGSMDGGAPALTSLTNMLKYFFGVGLPLVVLGLAILVKILSNFGIMKSWTENLSTQDNRKTSDVPSTPTENA